MTSENGLGSKNSMIFEKYRDQLLHWPVTGRHILLAQPGVASRAGIDSRPGRSDRDWPGLLSGNIKLVFQP